MNCRAAILALLLLALPGAALAEQCVVIGDSLTKEYEVEFPALFPTNPASWDSRNWIEILHERRKTWFDLGEFDGYADPRLTGHEHNWAFPGATTTEIKTQLSRIQNFWWIMELEGQIEDQAERIVIFAGGNDVDSYYGQIYNGASAASYINTTRDNLQWIVDYVRGVKGNIPIVLVSVPHLGCAPDVQRQYPTDAIKTARVTAALDSLNSQLATFAQLRNIGFVPGVYQLTKDIITQPFRVSGIEFYREADMDARPRYVFSGDGFHPAVVAHGKIAQMVIEAFRARYPTQITPLSDREIVQNILGLDPDLPFREWMASQGAPAGQDGLADDPDGDGLANATEFALEGGSASQPNAALACPQKDTTANELVWTWKLRPEAAEWATFRMEQSPDLKVWQAAPNDSITTHADGSQTLRSPLSNRQFFRFRMLP